MQRFRFLSVVLATGFVSGTFLAQADPDTAAQAAARAALQQQMNQTDTDQGTNSAAPPAVPTPEPAVPTTSPPPVTVPTPQFSTNVPMNVSTNIPMNDEMESDLAGMKTNESAAVQMKSQTNNIAPIAVPPPLVLNTNETEQYPVNPAMAPLPPPDATSTTPPVTPAIHPMLIPEPGSGSQTPANPGAVPPAVGSGPSLKGEQTTNSAPNFETITAPPLPITAEKQAELQSLLSQYLANQITPGQYQEQRAKIMAEP